MATHELTRPSAEPPLLEQARARQHELTRRFEGLLARAGLTPALVERLVARTARDPLVRQQRAAGTASPFPVVRAPAPAGSPLPHLNRNPRALRA